MGPLLTIVVPVGPNPTDRLMNNLMGQRIPEWLETIAVGTESSLREWAKWASSCNTSGRVRAKYLEVQGPSSKRNHGARSATSPFLLFVDEDDEIDIERLSGAVATAVKAEGASWTVHQFPYEVRREGKTSKKSNAGVFLHHSSTIIPRSLFGSVGGYPETEAEDAILLARLSRFPHRFYDTAKPFFCWIDESSADRRSKSNRSEADLFRELVAIDASPKIESHDLGKSLSLHRFAVISARPSMSLERLWDLVQLIADGNTPKPDAETTKQLKLTQVKALQRETVSSGFCKERKVLLAFLLDSLRYPDLKTCWPNVSAALGDWNSVLSAGKFGVTGKKPPQLPAIQLEFDHTNELTETVLNHYLKPTSRYSSFSVIRSSSNVPEHNKDSKRVAMSAKHTFFSSQLLRIGQDSRSVERKMASYFAASRLRQLFSNPDEKLFRLYGTGPSASNVTGLAPGVNGYGVACNSWVKRPDLLKTLGVNVVVAGDPVFHAGPSDYAKKFREDLTNWLRLDENHFFVTVTRDAHIYAHYLPADVHSQVLTLDMRVPLLSSSKAKLNSMHDGGIPPYSNVLPLLLLPVAIIGEARHIHLSGFDGDKSDNSERFWDHSKTVQYVELLDSVEQMHPEFFERDYRSYRESVSNQTDDVLSALQEVRCEVSTEVPSNHESLRNTARTRRLHTFD